MHVYLTFHFTYKSLNSRLSKRYSSYRYLMSLKDMHLRYTRGTGSKQRRSQEFDLGGYKINVN